jgi:hypothetical protein
MRSFWNMPTRRAEARIRRRRPLKPILESFEERLLMHGGAHGHLATTAPTATAEVAGASSNPLAHYRVFEGTITRGPAAGRVTLDGPLVLGFGGRIQFSGYLFQQGGPVIYVFGTQTGGGVAMTFNIPTTHHTTERVLAFGSGQLERVPGGLPGGLTLVGSGNLQGPDLKRDTGHWKTVAPSKVAGVPG